jgi:NTP pyrophosphatase (non-canonical NTP hydrolase)
MEQSDIQKLTDEIVQFRDEREWKQFHNPKDCAVSLMLEAAEFMEHFQWKNSVEMEDHIESNREDVEDELADVLYWVLLISHDLNIDIVKALERKNKKNAEKYPIEKAKGKHTKYNKL